jgi:putative phosphoribosyl transferase
VQALDIPADWIEAVDAEERRVLARVNRDHRGDRPPPELAGRTVILVDEGATVGETMVAAVRAVRLEDPACVVVGLPVADAGTCEELGAIADEVVCLHTPRPLRSIAEWYDDFTLVPDDDVRGPCATATWRTRSTRSSTISGAGTAGGRRRSCGTTTRTSATRGRPS